MAYIPLPDSGADLIVGHPRVLMRQPVLMGMNQCQVHSRTDSISVKIEGMAILESSPAAAAVTCCGLATTPVTSADAERLAPLFKALGDPVRLRMASMIAAAPELCVCEIAPEFDLSSATISHHLKTLREAGLVDSERRGTYVYYWIRPEALAALSALLSVS